VLAQAGKEDEALVAVSAMHRKGLFTRQSLELYRDLTFKRDLLDKSQAAQALLARKYPDDVMVRWNGGMLALKAGKLDSAQQIFENLAAKYPEAEQFEWARLTMFLAKEQFERAIRECAESDAPAHVTGPIQARAYRRLDKPDLARKAYRRALASKKTPSLMMQYADFLIDAGDNRAASAVYREIIASAGDKLAADSMNNAIVLNNLAWSLIEDGADLKTGLEAAQKAYGLEPGNPHILDTYATGLIKSGKYNTAIELLEDNPLTAKEARLRFHLATAYEKSGATALALRGYRTALDAMDGEGALKMPLNQESLRRHIDALENR
jgi:Tfp pilus assembly protein PilF